MLSPDQQTSKTWDESAILSRDTVARKLRDRLAIHFGVDPKEFQRDVQFAAAIETIVENCGPDARELLLSGKRHQKVKGIMELSRTSDARQRYRIDGVRSGRFRSVAPQNDDPVYDTVKFSEVTGRLRRARGKFQLLPGDLKSVRGAVLRECRRLADLCRESACALQRFLDADPGGLPAIPSHLEKDLVLPSMKDRRVRGQAIGIARFSLRLTIKSVWDFPEMQERGIVPSEIERAQTIQETNEIIGIAAKVLRR